jgi:hypothetical protein
MGVIRTFIGREGPFGIHSEDKLLRGEPNVKREVRIRRDRGEVRLLGPVKNIRVSRAQSGLELGVFGPNIPRAKFELRCFKFA